MHIYIIERERKGEGGQGGRRGGGRGGEDDDMDA